MSAIDNQALRWFQLKSERELDANEQAALDAWLAEDSRHRGAFARAAAIDFVISQAAERQSAFPDTAQYDEPAVNESEARPHRFWKWGTLAAACILSAGLALHYSGDQTTLTTAKGEFRRVALADLSVANINSASKLEVKLSRDLRRVTLQQGEAWFEVAKNKARPFVVETGDVRVKAVGTAFGVRRFDGGAEVLVTEGVVEVSNGAATTTRLAAGERAVVRFRKADITVARQPAEVSRKLAWRDGKLIFSRQTLSEAVADFNRYSLRKIVIGDPSIENKLIFGQYQIDAPESFARDISVFLEVPVSVTPDKIVIGAAKAAKDDS